MSQQNEKVIIIGGGIGGLATAGLLAKKGFDVTLFEKNNLVGGRANIFVEKGYTFDMGPSWYMMPEIFEDFFKLVGEDIHQYMKIERLTPSYRIFLSSEQKFYDFFSDRERNGAVFESIETGSRQKLFDYLDEAKRQYTIAKKEFMYKNYDSFFDFLTPRIMTEGGKLKILSKMDSIIKKIFKSELLQKVMQFQMILLGTIPKDAPGIYQLMNHVDFDLGIWYPHKGIYELIKSLAHIAEKNGVTIHTNSPIKKIIVENDTAVGVLLENGEEYRADIVISNADIHHTETALLEEKYRDHSETYWEKRTLAPSALILYLGVNKKLPSLTHHNLLFSKDWDVNFAQIVRPTIFPTDPSIYVSCPSKTDQTVAPEGKENLFVLVPIASGLSYDDKTLDEWVNKTLEILEKDMGLTGLRESIEYKRVYCVEDFKKDYNSFKGSALGLAHTLGQSSVWRPNNVSKKVQNLYFVGANVNPGIGMPICIISAELVYKRIMNITAPEPLTEL